MAIPANAKCVFQGVIYDVYQWPETAYDGSTMIFEGLKRSDTTSVIALADGKVYYSLQEQPGREPFLSLFGGRVERDENPLEGAKRELLEEAGLTSDNWELFMQIPSANSRIEFTAYYYIARDCKKVDFQNPDPGEKIEVRTCEPDQLLDIIRDDKFRDSFLRNRLFSAFDSQQAQQLIAKIK